MCPVIYLSKTGRQTVGIKSEDFEFSSPNVGRDLSQSVGFRQNVDVINVVAPNVTVPRKWTTPRKNKTGLGPVSRTAQELVVKQGREIDSFRFKNEEKVKEEGKKERKKKIKERKKKV